MPDNRQMGESTNPVNRRWSSKALIRSEGEFFLIQGASLVFTLVAGFLLIRNLGIVGYGQYVLMVAMGQLLNALGNAGLLVGASQILTKSDKSDQTVLRIFSALSHLRLRYSLLAGAIVIALPAVLLHRIGLSSTSLIWAVLATIFYGSALISSSLYSEGFLLLGAAKVVSRYDAGFGVASAISSVITSSIFKDGAVVLAFLALSEMVRAILTRRRLYGRIGRPVAPAGEDLALLHRSYWSLLPNVAFASVRAEFVKFVLSVQGQAVTLGAFEGMRRFGRALAPFYKYITISVVPKLTRASDRKSFLRTSLRSLVFVMPPVVFLLAICCFFPAPLLSLLGDGFGRYQSELRLVGLLFIADLSQRFVLDATRSRGWLSWHKRYEIIGFVLVFTLSLLLLNLAELRDVIYMNLFALALSLCISLLDLRRGLREFPVPSTPALQPETT